MASAYPPFVGGRSVSLPLNPFFMMCLPNLRDFQMEDILSPSIGYRCSNIYNFLIGPPAYFLLPRYVKIL